MRLFLVNLEINFIIANFFSKKIHYLAKIFSKTLHFSRYAAAQTIPPREGSLNETYVKARSSPEYLFTFRQLFFLLLGLICIIATKLRYYANN